MGDSDVWNVLTDELSPEHRLDARQELKRLATAFDRLPDRCRAVVWLRRVEELPQKEVAARLGIGEKTVEKQVAKGMRLIADYFHGGSMRNTRGGTGSPAHRAATERDDDQQLAD
jgi:RNA polymerase sigma-70 factor (ECF subfamily)